MTCQSKSNLDINVYVSLVARLTAQQRISEDWFVPSQYGAGSWRCWSLCCLGTLWRRTDITVQAVL
jgi:hypothetical protein